MKKSTQWLSILKPDTPITIEVIEAIQRDALYNPMVQTTDQQELEMACSRGDWLSAECDRLRVEVERYQSKWHETRRYLRAANKGAERNAAALELAQNRYYELVQSDKRYKTRDEANHKTVIWNWLCISDEDLRLKLGELTNPEIRTIRALLRAMLGTSLLRL